MTLSRLATSALYEKYTPAGIAGYGGWASVTAATGTYTTGTYNDGAVDWVYYQWTGAGSVTTTAGVVDVFMISGGGGANGGSQEGSGGRTLSGLKLFSSGTHSVTVGAGGGSTQPGDPSTIGSFTTYASPGYYGGAGGVKGSASSFGQPISSSITGSAVTYGQDARYGGAPRTNRGDGGQLSGAGSSGVVIIRVPVNPELWGLPPVPNATSGIQGFTSSGTYVVPPYCSSMDVFVVGGGASGSGGGSTNDVTYNVGGEGGVVTSQTVAVVPGETLTIVIGAGGSGSSVDGNTSSISGLFGSVTAAGGTTHNNGGGGGTFTSPWGWYGANGPSTRFGGSQPGYSSNDPGAGRGGGPNGVGAMHGKANTGGGGADSNRGGNNGGSGFVGIFVR